MDEWKKHADELRVKEGEVYVEKADDKKAKKEKKKSKPENLEQIGTFEIDLKDILDVYTQADNIPTDEIAAQS